MSDDLLQRLRGILTDVERVASGGPRPFDTVFDEVLSPSEALIEGRRTLVFGSNNYFGLTFHPEVLAAMKCAVERYGSGTTGSRVANGSYAIHAALERELAAHFQKRHALVTTTGYQANLSIVTALCGPGDLLILDAASHASLFDAGRLSGATVVAFRHNAPDSLSRQLDRTISGRRNRLVVVEGLYSIGGDLAPLSEIAAICRAAGAYLVVDEAHSFGAYGARGLGWCEAAGVLEQVDFVVGTFSKALGGVGGFVVSDHDELEGLHFLARPYVFTASGVPATIEGVRAALRILSRDESLRLRLWEVVERVRHGLARLGYTVGQTASPIVPILLGEASRAVTVWQAFLRGGLYANIVLPPACPSDGCLIRFSCSAAHSDAVVDEALTIAATIGRAVGIIPPS